LILLAAFPPRNEEKIMSFNTNEANHLSDRAQSVCRRLADGGTRDPELVNNATVLRPMISTILALLEDADDGGNPEISTKVLDLAIAVADATTPLLTFADSRGESEMSAQLNVASILVSSIEAVARSELLSLHQKELLSDAVGSLVYPALHLVVRTIDPDKHEDDVVDNRAVQLGWNAMLLARRLSALWVSPSHALAAGLINIWNTRA